MSDEEHEIDSCRQYGEEIRDGICHEPRIHSLICVNCRFNKGPSIKPKTSGPPAKEFIDEFGKSEAVEIPTEEPPTEEEELKAIEKAEAEMAEQKEADLEELKEIEKSEE